MNEVINERSVVSWSGPATGSALHAVPRRVLPIVLGMHRSGTSLTAGALHRLGIDMTDGDLRPNEFNKGGYYERYSLVDLHDRLLGMLGNRWDSLSPLPPGWWRDPPAMAIRAEIVAKLKVEIPQSPQRLWGLKDPRLMRLLPLWLDICMDLNLEPRIILVTRNPDEVAASLARRDNMPHEDALVLWAVYHMEFLQHVGNTPWTSVDQEHWLDDHRSHVTRLMRFLGVPSALHSHEMLAVDDWINPDWTTNVRSGRRSRSFAHWLYERLNALPSLDGENGLEFSSELRRSAHDFHVFARVFRPVFKKAESFPSVEAALHTAEETVATRDAAVLELRTRLAETTADLSECRAQRDGAWQEIASLKEQTSDLQAMVQALETERGQTQAEHTMMRERIAQLEAALAETRADRDDARERAETHGSEAAELRERAAELEQAATRREREIKTAQADLATLRERVAQLETTLTETRADRDTAHTQAEAAQAEHTVMRERIAQLETTLTEARADRDDARKRAETHGSEASDLRERTAELEQAATRRESDIKTAQADLATLRERVAQLETALSETRADRDTAHTQAEAAQADLTALRERIAQLESTLAETRTDREAARKQINAARADLVTLRERIAQLEAALAETRANRDAIRKQAETHGSEAATLRERTVELEQAATRREREIKTAQADLTALRERVAQLETALTETCTHRDAARMQAEATQVDLTALRDRAAQLEAALAETRADRDAARMRAETHGSETVALRGRTIELEQAAEVLRIELAALRDQTDRLGAVLHETGADRDAHRDRADLLGQEVTALIAVRDMLQSQNRQIESDLHHANEERTATQSQIDDLKALYESEKIRARELEKSMASLLNEFNQSLALNGQLESA